jgi:hypothetical protein
MAVLANNSAKGLNFTNISKYKVGMLAINIKTEMWIRARPGINCNSGTLRARAENHA